MKEHSLCVIVPVFNMIKYVGNCIDSLLAQSYNNIHIVLVNDCSTDNTLEILIDYQNKYPNKITVIDSKVNMRQGGARNLGIKNSQSDYIGFVDADDFVHPDMYKILMEEANKNNADAVYCRYEKVDQNTSFDDIKSDNMIIKKSDNINYYTGIPDKERMELIISSEIGCVWGGIYSRKLIIDNNIFFPEHILYEDNYWVYVAKMYLKSVSIIPYKLYYYRQQENSVMHKKNAVHQYDGIEIGRRLLSFVKEKNFFEKYYEAIEYVFINVFTCNLFSRLIDNFDCPEEKKLNIVKYNLKREFPKWRENKYYKSNLSLKNKIKINLITILPTKLYLLLDKARRFIGNILKHIKR